MPRIRLSWAPMGVELQASRLSRVLALWGVLLVGGTTFAQGSDLTGDVFDRVKQSVVQVQAVCPSGSGQGTTKRKSHGFVFGEAGEVLTTLHGVAQCHEVRVHLFGGEDFAYVGQPLPADVVSILKSADLAMLKLKQRPPPDWPSPLQAYGQGPPPGTEIFIVARYLDSPAPRSGRFNVVHGPKKLEHLVNGKTKQQLETQQFPSLQQEIVNISGGVIIPGISGAPFVNREGQVVAIADGGLEDGLTQVNWAIPASAVEQLAKSSETPADAPRVAVVQELFSAEQEILELEIEQRPSIQCGDRKFVMLRTVKLSDLLAFSDDLPGSLELLRNVSFDPTQATFDVYQDLDSGAVIAVPSGGKLQSLADGCVAMLDESGNIMVALMAKTITSPEEESSAMEEYEAFIAAVTQDLPWTPVPKFSSGPELRQADGLFMSRLMFIRNVFTEDELGQPHPIQQAWFQTIAARGDTFVSYSVFVIKPEASGLVEEWGCLASQEATLACVDQVNLEDLAFAAVQLTTFPLH